MGTRHLKTLEIRKKTHSSTKINKNQEKKIKNIKVNQKKGECRRRSSVGGTIDKIIVWPLGLGYEWSGLSLYVRTQVHRHNLRCR